VAHATPVGGVARGGRVRGNSLLAISVLAVLGCAGSEPASPEAGGAIPRATGVSIHVARPPSGEERYCAWYGDEGPDQVLYFGEAAFWSAKAKAGADPTADDASDEK